MLKNYIPITELNMKRIAFGYDDKGYALISATKDNKIVEQIKEHICNYKYLFIPIYVKNKSDSEYDTPEKSFIIYPYRRNKTSVDWVTFEKDMYDIANSQEGTYIVFAEGTLNIEAYFVEQPQTINGNRKRQQHDGELTLFGYNKI